MMVKSRQNKKKCSTSDKTPGLTSAAEPNIPPPSCYPHLSAALGVLPASDARFLVIMSSWLLSLERGKSMAMLTRATSEQSGEVRAELPDLA